MASHGTAATAAVLRSLGIDQRPLRRLLHARHHHDMQHQKQHTPEQEQEQERVVPGGQQQRRQLQLEPGQQHRPERGNPGAAAATQAATLGDVAGSGASHQQVETGVGQRLSDTGRASSGLSASAADSSSSKTESAHSETGGGAGGEVSGEEEGSQLQAPRVALAAADQGVAAGLVAEAEDAAEAGQPEPVQSLQAGAPVTTRRACVNTLVRGYCAGVRGGCCSWVRTCSLCGVYAVADLLRDSLLHAASGILRFL